MNFDRIYILPITSKLHFSLSFIGIFFYLSIMILFSFYYNCLFLIKEEIFSYILLKSLFSLIESAIESDEIRMVFVFITQIILFSLLLFHLDRCFTQKKIVEDTTDLEIKEKNYIILIYILCLIPFDSYFTILTSEMIAQNIIKAALIIMFYKSIEKKIKIMIDRLNQQQAKSTKVNKNSDILENNENYYIEMLQSINSMYSAGAVLFVFCFLINIYTSYYQNELIQYFSEMVKDSALFFISLAQLLFFYCSNKIELEQSLKKNKINDAFKKFVKIKIFNQDDADENSSFK
jgi:hypothetical protein